MHSDRGPQISVGIYRDGDVQVVVEGAKGLAPMPDVFISYAKTDRPLASKLAAMLEAEGWTTWWDTSLTIGDDFRNEIMTELGRARAVIVIWTDTSIKSDWVRSEAGRAQADRKLIPVKLAHLEYEDLPPPFDVLHTENVGAEDKIKAAVVAQLSKPEVEPSAWALLCKGCRYELLTWVGIVGGALTLFTNLGSVLKLADWARVLVEHWKEWTHAFWVWVFDWLGIHLPPDWALILTFLSFGSFLIIGQAIKVNQASKREPIAGQYTEKSFRLISRRTISCLVLVLVVVFCPPIAVGAVYPTYVATTIVILAWVITPQVIIVLFARQRLHTALSLSLFFTFFCIILVLNIGRKVPSLDVSTASVLLGFILPIVLLSVAP